MNEIQVKTTHQQIEAFKALFADGIRKIVEASAIYVEAIDHDPEAAELFAKACPNVPSGAWIGFEAVGRNWMDYRLLLSGGTVTKIMRRLPKSQQTKALDEGVELLVGNGEHLNTQVQNLTPKQARQVFADDHIRDLAQQRAYIESCRPNQSTEYKPSYNVVRGVLHINTPTTITRKELTRILMEMN